MAVVERTPPAVRIDDAYFPLVVLSKYAGLSVRTLRSYLTDRTRPLPHYRVGGKLLVKRSEFDAWMSAFRDAGEAAAIVDRLAADLLRGL